MCIYVSYIYTKYLSLYSLSLYISIYIFITYTCIYPPKNYLSICAYIYIYNFLYIDI